MHCEVCAGGLRVRPRCVVGGRGVRGGFVVMRGRGSGGWLWLMGSLWYCLMVNELNGSMKGLGVGAEAGMECKEDLQGLRHFSVSPVRLWSLHGAASTFPRVSSHTWPHLTSPTWPSLCSGSVDGKHSTKYHHPPLLLCPRDSSPFFLSHLPPSLPLTPSPTATAHPSILQQRSNVIISHVTAPLDQTLARSNNRTFVCYSLPRLCQSSLLPPLIPANMSSLAGRGRGKIRPPRRVSRPHSCTAPLAAFHNILVTAYIAIQSLAQCLPHSMLTRQLAYRVSPAQT